MAIAARRSVVQRDHRGRAGSHLYLQPLIRDRQRHHSGHFHADRDSVEQRRGRQLHISVTGSDANNLAPIDGSQMLTLTAVPTGAPNYILAATALNPASVTSGSVSNSTITVIPANGYSGSVSLSCGAITGGSVAPDCSFNPSLVTVSGTAPGTSTLTLSTMSSAAAGNYTISVVGNDTNNLAPINGSQALTLNTTTLIQHIVVIFQENRTPDNLFQDPVLISRGADIASSGLNSLGQTIPSARSIWVRPVLSPELRPWPLPCRLRRHVRRRQNGRRRPSSARRTAPADCPPNPQFMYVIPSDVQPYFAFGRAIHVRRPHVSDQPRSELSRSPVHHFRHLGAHGHQPPVRRRNPIAGQSLDASLLPTA